MITRWTTKDERITQPGSMCSDHSTTVQAVPFESKSVYNYIVL